MAIQQQTNGTFRPDLGVVAYNFFIEADQHGFIAQQLMPLFPVAEKSGYYPVIDSAAWFRVLDTRRASRASYSRDDFIVKQQEYETHENGIESILYDDEMMLYNNKFNGEEVAVQRAIGIILRRLEKDVFDLITTEANVGKKVNVSTAWNNLDTAGPRTDIQTAIRDCRLTSGVTPRALALNYSQFSRVLDSAEFKDYTKYTATPLLDGFETQKAMVASFFGIQQLLIADAIINTGKNSTLDLADMWPSDTVALLENGIFLDKKGQGMVQNDLQLPAYGRTFQWVNDAPSITFVESYRVEEVRGTVFRVRNHLAPNIVNKGSAYLLGNITA